MSKNNSIVISGNNSGITSKSTDHNSIDGTKNTCTHNGTCNNGTCANSTCNNATCANSTCNNATCANSTCNNATCANSTCNNATCANSTCNNATCANSTCNNATCANSTANNNTNNTTANTNNANNNTANTNNNNNNTDTANANTADTNNTTRSNSTISKGNNVNDTNSFVTNGVTINNATVTEKRQQAVVLKYEFGGKNCTGVMHVSQFPSLDRITRDQLFANVAVGAKYDGLEANVEPADKSQGRRFTSVRLSARKPLELAADQKRQSIQVQREEQEAAQGDAVKAVDGKIVMATIKKLAFAKDPQTKKETDHCYGAFLKTSVDGIEVSGLLHCSRMLGQLRVERLVDSFQAETSFEVVASVTEKGVSFSEEGVQAARASAALEQRTAHLADERNNFLTCIREALAAGTPEKMAFQAKVTANRLESNGGISAECCGVSVEVSSVDLALSLRGTGHSVKLVATSEKNGVLTAKRFVKGK